MDIDYSLPSGTTNSFALAAKTPFMYGKRHLLMWGMNFYLKRNLNVSMLSWKQSLKHLALGTLEMIPVLGHAVAFIDKTVNHREIRVIRLKSTDPYEMGKEQGVLLKNEIQTLVTKLLMVFRSNMRRYQGKNPLVEAKKLAEHIPPAYLKEMEGIAAGSGVPFNDLLIANTIMDTMNLFGCSLFAISHDTQNNSTTRLCATNYFSSFGQKPDVPDVDESFRRYNDLQAHSSSTNIDSLKAALLKVNYYDTIQSIVFDQRDIHLAIAGEYAANTPYTHIKGNELFPNKPMANTTKKVVKLTRNLDWPLPVLGRESFILVRPAHDGKKATAVVGWPGMIGALSGVNDEGTAISITVVPSVRQAGIPAHLLFRQVLEKAGSIKEAEKVVQAATPASSWNLIVAATDGIARFELDPARQQKGAADSVIQG